MWFSEGTPNCLSYSAMTTERAGGCLKTALIEDITPVRKRMSTSQALWKRAVVSVRRSCSAFETIVSVCRPATRRCAATAWISSDQWTVGSGFQILARSVVGVGGAGAARVKTAAVCLDGGGGATMSVCGVATVLVPGERIDSDAR